MSLNTLHQACACPVCRVQVYPRIRFYKKSPDALICPHCETALGQLSSSARQSDRLLVGVLAVAGVLCTLGLVL
jgi:hypothetical protein